MTSNSSDIKTQMNQLSQQMKALMKIKQINNKLDLTFNSIIVNSGFSQTINTSNENNLIKQIKDLNDIKKCCIDLTNRSTNDLNQSDDSFSCQSSAEEVADESDIDCGQRVKRVKTLKGRYVCDYKDCGKSYCNKRHLRRHQKSHSGKRYFCDHKKCVKYFRDVNALSYHKKSGAHVLGQSFTCGLNDYQTKHKDQLETHIGSHPISDYNRDYERHGKTIDGKYECDLIGCHQKFKYSYDMLKHKRIHLCHIYRCDVKGCGHTFATLNYLRKHKSSQHITKYRCDRNGCDYKAGHKWQLNKHLKRHSNERLSKI